MPKNKPDWGRIDRALQQIAHSRCFARMYANRDSYFWRMQIVEMPKDSQMVFVRTNHKDQSCEILSRFPRGTTILEAYGVEDDLHAIRTVELHNTTPVLLLIDKELHSYRLFKKVLWSLTSKLLGRLIQPQYNMAVDHWSHPTDVESLPSDLCLMIANYLREGDLNPVRNCLKKIGVEENLANRVGIIDQVSAKKLKGLTLCTME